MLGGGTGRDRVDGGACGVDGVELWTGRGPTDQWKVAVVVAEALVAVTVTVHVPGEVGLPLM